MFAVLKTGGKQYKVAKDDVFTVEKLAAEAGETIQFNEILMLGGDKVTVGAPLVAGAGVQAEVIDQTKGAKVINFKKRRRKHSSQRKKGHRQQLTLIKVTDILASGADKSGVKAAVGAGSVAGVAIAAAAAAAKPAAKKKAAPKKEAKQRAKRMISRRSAALVQSSKALCTKSACSISGRSLNGAKQKLTLWMTNCRLKVVSNVMSGSSRLQSLLKNPASKEQDAWHIKKQVARPETVATQQAAVLA